MIFVNNITKLVVYKQITMMSDYVLQNTIFGFSFRNYSNLYHNGTNRNIFTKYMMEVIYESGG